MIRPTLIAGIAILTAIVSPITAAQEPSYPSKPIRIVVPYSPGGLGDFNARRVAKGLTERFGQPVLVENKPGATQIIGAEAVARSPADGYTLFFASLTSLVLNAHGFKKLPYDPIKDFAPVSLVMQTPLYLLVNGSSPAKSVSELVALAKAKPHALSYASLGIGSSYHVVMEMFKATVGIEVTHVPYKGSNPGLMALLSNEVQMMFDAGGISNTHISEGRLRAIAVTGERRNSALPDVPTLTEAGVPGFDLSVWFGLVAPAGTPRPIVERLSAEIGAIVQSRDFQAHAVQNGYEAVSSTPAEFSKLLTGDFDRWGKLFNVAGVTPQ